MAMESSEESYKESLKKPQTPKKRVTFAGDNELGKIAITATVIGLIGGISIVSRGRLGLYVLSLCVYHLLEFVLTAKYRPREATVHLFLIWGAKGSKEFYMAQSFGIFEYFVTSRGHSSNIWQLLGLALILCGQLLRSLAMIHCGDQFLHYVVTDTSENDRLVTNGVYGYFRHPLYVGFILLTLGQQVLLENVICFIIACAVLYVFFLQRIRFEEYYLRKRFGLEYLEYLKRVVF